MSDTYLPVMIDGVSAIADQFDGYLVDLWGCVHNGIEPYPEAVEALLNLAAQGEDHKSVVERAAAGRGLDRKTGSNGRSARGISLCDVLWRGRLACAGR